MIYFEECRRYVGSKTALRMPTRATASSAGYDFYNIDEPVLIPAHESAMIKTGVKVKMDPNLVLMLFIRSSMAIKHGLRLTNQVGVIDADYYDNPDNEGEICISLYNANDKDIEIHPYERVAQGVFLSYSITDDDTACGIRQGGIGSTGA